ncbi:MAG TPA: M13 family metallopeptidase [Thermoanaerobaculia bacterium]|nr:M13 family metallopeptidase [Thermoanaerobaculia bacterium]
MLSKRSHFLFVVAGSALLAATLPAVEPENAAAAPGEISALRLKTLDTAGMDTSASACTDFYQYADGGWIAKNPIPADRPRWGSFDELRQRNVDDLHRILDRLSANPPAAGTEERKVADFYAACMDEAGIEARGLAPIEPELSKIEAIHDLPGLRAETTRLQAMGVGALFNFGSEEDRKNSSEVIAAAVQGGLGLPDRDYYTKTDEKSVKTREQYQEHVAKMLELAGAPKEKAAKDAAAILALETKLAQASQSNVDIRNPDLTHHPMALDAFSKATPNLEWAAFFREQSIPATTINVWQPDFFKAADRLLKSEPLSTWKTYLRWHLLNTAAPTLPKRFVDENFAFYGTTLAGTPENQPRWKRCVTATDSAVGMALGRLYVQEYFPPAAKKRADELVHNVLAALDDDVKTLTWMGPATKKAAAEKVAAINPKIGYPDHWRDYSTLAVTRDAYAANALAANEYETKRDLAKIGKPVDRTDWGMTPPTVNAYYNPARNEIVFPAGIFQPPFFYADGDDAINYGAIGGVIGHEITHGFDNSGRKFDAKGNQVDWWTAEDAKNFDERAQCIISQFDGYKVQPDLPENGKLVQGESIADLGGLTIAHRAYLKSLEGRLAPAPIDGLTADQRFFVSYARIWAGKFRPEFERLWVQTNEHPVGMYRAIGTASNMPEFAAAFGCNAGSPMVREPRCQIW